MAVNCEEYKKKNHIKMKIPFSSSRKRMSIIAQYKGSAYIFTKGAS
jgi:magnesium-transporting ATPase (P-type)